MCITSPTQDQNLRLDVWDEKPPKFCPLGVYYLARETYEISMIEHELVMGNVDSPFLGEIAT